MPEETKRENPTRENPTPDATGGGEVTTDDGKPENWVNLCPACGALYVLGDTRVAMQEENITFSRCDNCKKNAIAEILDRRLVTLWDALTLLTGASEENGRFADLPEGERFRVHASLMHSAVVIRVGQAILDGLKSAPDLPPEGAQ